MTLRSMMKLLTYPRAFSVPKSPLDLGAGDLVASFSSIDENRSGISGNCSFLLFTGTIFCLNFMPVPSESAQ